MREHELRESTEKQLALEQRDKIVLTKRLKKEKKARKRLQEQVEQLDPKAAAALQVNSSRESGSQDRDSDSDQMPVPHPPKPSSVENLRMLNGKHSLSEITLNILSQKLKTKPGIKQTGSWYFTNQISMLRLLRTVVIEYEI